MEKGYCTFAVETHMELFYYRDNNCRNVEELMKRYAECDGYLPKFTENCEEISCAEYAAYV